MMRILLGASLAVLVGCASGDQKQHIEAQRDTANIENYSIIHKRGSACPSGWKLDAKRFTERDGSTWDACLNPKPTKGNSIDYLAGGEGITQSIPLTPLPAEPEESKKI